MPPISAQRAQQGFARSEQSYTDVVRSGKVSGKHPEMIEVDAIEAILNAGEDVFRYVLTPEVLPGFYAWMKAQRGVVASSYELGHMRTDLETLLGGIKELKGGD